MKVEDLSVLLVDGDNDSRDGGRVFLELEGIKDERIDAATNEWQAIGYMRRKKYDLIISYTTVGENYPMMKMVIRDAKVIDKSVVVGLLSTPESKDLWRDLTHYLFSRRDFYVSGGLKQVLEEKFGIKS